MKDKRDTQRQNVMKAGTILFGGSGIDCLVRNMSVGGANLEVESQIGIPSSFELSITNFRCTHIKEVGHSTAAQQLFQAARKERSDLVSGGKIRPSIDSGRSVQRHVGIEVELFSR